MERNNIRLDELLVMLGHSENRTRAKALILAGKVRCGTEILDKPGKSFPRDLKVEISLPPRFVGRGGEKLEAYLDAFPISLDGKRSLDVGASTGGFTDCLVQRGVTTAICVDVGRAQLHHKLLTDPRVTNFEKLNARYLTPDQLPYPDYDIIVMDLSFISLKKVIPAIWPLLKPTGKLIALVKPQFEADRKEVDKGRGVIADDKVRFAVLEDIKKWMTSNYKDLEVEDTLESPISGGDGNREFLLGVTKQG